MKRKCEHIISSVDGKRAIYIDSLNKNEILEYINRDKRHQGKFRYIVEIILGGYKNTSLYDKEDINEKCKDVTAMKFFKGQENDRIYCKEIHTQQGVFIVVTSILYEHKKGTRLSSKEIALIERVGGYEYEI
ncbi:MAG: hypothetical protein Q8907_08190 [Bacteroidota bacterium]|nr:hypothetical protein [Bacteroidota bacterium]MDP4274242.1 hypothetical protein [Bacteroidota bacterium]